LALRTGVNVICEKPLVVSPWNLDALRELELETKARIHTVMQLRLNPNLQEVRHRLREESSSCRRDVCLTYITGRGAWYDVSWKGSIEKSGGIATNIGVHLFDLLIWLFGDVGECRIYHADPHRVSGYLEFTTARVKWFLSVDPSDVPPNVRACGRSTYRYLAIDGQQLDLTDGFTDLHTRVYEETLAGRGFGIEDSRPSIELAYKVRTSPLSTWDDRIHPLLKTI
jgi:UDP-N-acetyl-2-amino-2-deoxyglucuronate dehydrogenase